jgi:hypothetical protein
VALLPLLVAGAAAAGVAGPATLLLLLAAAAAEPRRVAPCLAVQVRAGTGGEEAALWAADLIRLYQKYADTQVCCSTGPEISAAYTIDARTLQHDFGRRIWYFPNPAAGWRSCLCLSISC